MKRRTLLAAAVAAIAAPALPGPVAPRVLTMADLDRFMDSQEPMVFIDFDWTPHLIGDGSAYAGTHPLFTGELVHFNGVRIVKDARR